MSRIPELLVELVKSVIKEIESKKFWEIIYCPLGFQILKVTYIVDMFV